MAIDNGDLIQVDPAAIEQAASDIQAAVTGFQGNLEQLQAASRKAGLVWIANSNDAYSQCITRIQNAQNNLNSVCNKLGVEAINYMQATVRTDAAAASRLQGDAGQLT